MKKKETDQTQNEGKESVHIIYMKKNGRMIVDQKGMGESIGRHNECRLLSMGYYNTFSYISEGSSVFDYRHLFSIVYPFKQDKCPSLAEQQFSVIAQNADGPSLFEFTPGQRRAKPFLGMILVNLTVRGENHVSYQEALERYRGCVGGKIKEAGQESCCKIFQTINCADLCVALRTDDLKDIYGINRMLNEQGRTMENDVRVHIQTSVYIAMETMDILESSGFSDDIVEKNREHRVELRIGCSRDMWPDLDRLKESENMEGVQVFGTTGIGEYSLEIPFEIFSQIYGAVEKIELGYRESQWDKPDQEKNPLQKMLEEYQKDIFYFYDRCYISWEGKKCPVGHGPHEGENPSGGSDDEYEYSGIMDWMEGKVDRLMSDEYLSDLSNSIPGVQFPGNKVHNPEFPENSYREQMNLIKDLLYTYNDFWFHETSVDRGIMFYAQIEALLRGIEEQIFLMKQVPVWKPEVLQTMFEDLLKAMNISVLSINNFNRLIQSINENVRNVPNYEMQTKVNVEKYLLAYTMYLLRLFKGYREQEAGREMVLPIFTIGQLSRNITAYAFFGKLEMEGGVEIREFPSWIKSVVVLCPNYQRFANAYHVLPMITHEVSHNFRYLPRAERNRFIIALASEAIAAYLSARMVNRAEIKNYTGLVTDEKVKFLEANIVEALKKYIEMDLESALGGIRFNDIGVRIYESLFRFFPLESSEEKRNIEVWELLRDNLMRLMELAEVPYMDASEPVHAVTDDRKMSLYLNVIADIFRNDTEALGEWKNSLNSALSGHDDESFSLCLERIRDFETKGLIAEHAVGKAFRILVGRLVMKLFEQHQKLFSKEENKRCLEALADYYKMTAGEVCGCIRKIIRILEPEYGNAYEEGIGPGELCELNGRLERIKAVLELSDGFLFRYSFEKNKSFADFLHEKLKTAYEDALCHKEQWLSIEDTQRILQPMGITASKSGQFREFLAKIVEECSVHELKMRIEDCIRLYNEVSADLGMCRVFGFDAFGYFAYTIHIFIKERETPKSKGKNFTEERTSFVIRTLWGKEPEGRKREDYIAEKKAEFEAGIFRYGKTVFAAVKKVIPLEAEPEELSGISRREIRDLYDMIQKTPEVKRKHILLMHCKMFYWMKSLYEDMFLDELSIRSYMMYQKHLWKVYDAIKAADFMGIYENDEITGDIGAYYNNYSFDMEDDNIRKSSLIHQNHFVLEQYQKYMNLCKKVKGTLPDKMQDMENFSIVDGVLAKEE